MENQYLYFKRKEKMIIFYKESLHLLKLGVESRYFLKVGKLNKNKSFDFPFCSLNNKIHI